VQFSLNADQKSWDVQKISKYIFWVSKNNRRHWLCQLNKSKIPVASRQVIKRLYYLVILNLSLIAPLEWYLLRLLGDNLGPDVRVYYPSVSL
jgi:hypothetical protein